MIRRQTLRSLAACLVLLPLALVGARLVAAPQAHLEGAIGPGSLYAIDVPPAWNGDLVLYAHGIVPAGEAVTPPSTQDGYAASRDRLLAAGFAVAASSYSSNGWALPDAVQRTHQLGKIFASKYGQPRRIFLVGHSLGALAVTKLAETYPTQYAGALPICGPLGGAVAEIAYAGDARVTFDYYFPGLLPGTPFDLPDDALFLSPADPGGPSPLFVAVASALAADPQRTFQWALAARLPFASQTELAYSALYVVGFGVRYTNALIDRVNGKIPYDNRETAYQVNATADPATNAYLAAMLNAGVARYEADRAAINFYRHNVEPTGRIGIPVLTLHTTRDPGIPYWHETLFAQKVAEAGRSALLRQRAIDRWGHCAVTADEIAAGFGELVAWVNSR